ncbi:MAG TPA: chemotaxis protein CheW [Thermodesulfovibrionales bacterium]|nr:chemotaxis protein CheW [Thermodesulfovibrionales bacterium]
MKFTIFNISDETFGIDISRVLEILRVQKIFTIPGLPGFLSGVMSVRGAVIPVMDLRRRFGMKPAGRKERIILVRYDQEKIGFLVDEIREILVLNPDEIRPSPSIFKGFKTEYLTGIGKKDDRIILILNIDTLLTSEERIWLQEAKELLEEKSAGTGTAAE